MRILGTLIILVVVAVVVAVYVIYSGSYDVSALTRHGRLLEWTAATAVDRAIHQQAKGIAVPPLNDPSQLATGFIHYKEMCELCHGAPGVLRDEIAEGLYPKPPDLQEAVKDWTPAELYWIVKNGLKDTGMPAFAPTHSEQDLWAITSFALRLPTMTPAQYDSLSRAAGPFGMGASRGQDDDHDEGVK